MSRSILAGLDALGRLIAIAQEDTGQGRRVANFLLSWHGREECGGWDPTDLWGLEAATAADLLAVLHLLCEEHAYPEHFGFGAELTRIDRLWRAGDAA